MSKVDPNDFFAECVEVIAERGAAYGGVEASFEAVADISGAITGKPITAHDVAIIMAIVKLVRMRGSPRKRDHYIDCAAYIAFAAELVK